MEYYTPAAGVDSAYHSQGTALSEYYVPAAAGATKETDYYIPAARGNASQSPSEYYTPAAFAAGYTPAPPGPLAQSGVRGPSSAQPATPQQSFSGSGVPGVPCGSAPRRAPPRGDPAIWTCISCFFTNNVANAKCILCSRPSPSVVDTDSGIQPTVAVQPPPSRNAADVQLRRRLDDLVEGQSCPICLSAPKDTVFQCGHQACGACASPLRTCHICRAPVLKRIHLYG